MNGTNRILRGNTRLLQGDEWVEAIMYQDEEDNVFVRPARSAWTGVAPRTMREAFGPGVNLQIEQARPRSVTLYNWFALIMLIVWGTAILLSILGWAPR